MRVSVSRAVLLAVAGASIASGVNAADLDIQGLVRFETAAKLTNDENPYNQLGNEMNGRTVRRDSSLLGPAAGGRADFYTRGIGQQNTATSPFNTVSPVGTTQGPLDSTGRTGADNQFNLLAGRAEVDFTLNINQQMTIYSKVRGYSQPDVFDETGSPDFFGGNLYSHDRGTLLEINGDNYMIDIPALYIDYNNGPLWIRAGNQQIAWGESLFFRVLDVPNGLDLRRHLVLDIAAEEFSDKRVAAPAVRGSYRVTDSFEIEAFAQMFSPSVLPNANTPYNLVGNEFELQQREVFKDEDNAINVGTRWQAQFGELGLQAIAVNRRNPDGVYRWANSNDTDLGGLLAGTPFDSDPTGVGSGIGFLHNANLVRLNMTNLGSASVNDFPKAQALGAFAVPFAPLTSAGVPNLTQTSQLFDNFFQNLGPLRGHIERTYKRENIFGVGSNYLIKADQDSVFDQLVLRAEASYTPDKAFTTNLGQDFLESDEVAVALVAEKYHRFTDAFPATFMVLQYLYKSDSDLFGRHLSGANGTDTSLPTGDDNFQAIAFAFQQPFPALVWRADFSVLYDIKGGAQFQPVVRWKPNEQFTMELFATILESNGGNDDIIQTVEWADEISLRVGYQF